MSPGLHVVLFEPEIPQNTGTIGRLCLGVGATLHLVHPLGFTITESALKRAGLDYWEHLNVIEHKSIEEFLETLPPSAPKVFIETRAGKTIYEHSFEPGTYLIFGKETTGIPDWVQNKYAQDFFRIPMFDARIRSLNLSNAVSICVYEAVRQLNFG